jgi:hypothetical protein
VAQDGQNGSGRLAVALLGQAAIAQARRLGEDLADPLTITGVGKNPDTRGHLEAALTRPVDYPRAARDRLSGCAGAGRAGW